MAYRGNGRGYPNATVSVDITGWNGASESNCIDFISRKTRVQVSNYHVEANGVLRGTVRNRNELNNLLNWSGTKFAGGTLKFAETAGNSGGGNSAVEALRNFLKARYNGEMKMLNLSAVKQDPSINAGGFFSTNSTSSKFFPALMKVAQDMKLDVLTVDLSGNELVDLTTISELPHTFPRLENLSLQNNLFARVRAFDGWKNKMNYVRELLLFGNPLMAQVTPAQVPQVKMDFMRVFPRLAVLNGEVLRNEEVLNRNLTFAFDAPKSMCFSDDEIRSMSTSFVSSFISLWDSKRADLMVLYQNESQFSVSVDTGSPHIVEGATDPNAFGYYLPVSRNLARVSSAKARQARLCVGQENIFRVFSQLPQTKHNLVERPDLFSIEAYRYAQLGGILITLHGSFTETAGPENLDAYTASVKSRMGHNRSKRLQLSRRSFDRTLIVIPGPNGSMIVASDLLLIRPYAGIDAWTIERKVVGPPPTAPPAPSPTVNDLPPEVRANLNPAQQELLVRVVLETKLNLQYGVMLCEQSGWEYQACIVNFKNSEATLPREAYI